MRSVSYVERVALDFTGNLFPQAVCLGDTDNNGLNELVVGDTNGKLYVYKNDDSKPWLTRSCIGMVTCVGVGDICNKGKNFVVAVGAEGWFHIFDLSGASSTSELSSHHDILFGEEQRVSFTQHIPANTKVMLISDIDGDGRCEMVVGYTDRVVRAFRWEDSSTDGSDHIAGQLVFLKKWLLEGQVDSLSVNPGPDGTPELMVSQPGCGYAVLLCTWRLDQDWTMKRDQPTVSGSEGLVRDVILHQTSGRIHNKNVSTHLIGSISRGPSEDESKSGLFALCTLDGTLKLMDGSENLLWSVQVDHQLFALEKLDVTGDGREEVVACAWDGQTYIIDQNRSVVRFQFDENVSAFCAGMFACKEGRNKPCLVYVSFNHKIYVYWRVQLEQMESTNLLKVLEESAEFSSLLQGTSVDTNDTSAVRSALHQILYFPEQPEEGPGGETASKAAHTEAA